MRPAVMLALALSLAVPCTLPVHAGEDAKEKAGAENTDARAEAEKRFQEYKDVQAASTKARTEAMKAVREAGEEGRDAAMKAYREVVAAENAKVEKAEAAFVEAFAKTDIEAWDASKSAELLENGILNLAEKKEETDMSAAIALYEKFLVKLPKSRSLNFVKTYYLPYAMISAGDLDAAQKRIAKLAEECEEQHRAGLNSMLADIKAMTGDFEGAQKDYAAILKGIPEKLERGDARASHKRYLEPKIALIGKAAPEIDSKQWLGGEARPLSALKGTVVLVDVWATW